MLTWSQVSGHYEILSILKNPKHEDYQQQEVVTPGGGERTKRRSEAIAGKISTLPYSIVHIPFVAQGRHLQSMVAADNPRYVNSAVGGYEM